MYKSNKYISLAALASAALKDADIVGTCLPQSQSDDFLSTNILVKSVERKNKEYTVIAPRSKNAALTLARHVSILSSLSIARENKEFTISTLIPIASYPIPNVGKAYIFEPVVGRPLDDADLFTSTSYASAVAKAISSLHSLKDTIAINNSLPAYTVTDIQRRLLSDLDEGMQTRKLPKALFSRWEKMIEDVSLWRLTPCVIHANLSADSFYVKSYMVSGIVDFTNMHIGDPAEDFAWLFGVASSDTLNRVFKVYNQLNPQPDFKSFVERAKLHSELMILKWLLHGVHTNNNEIVEDAAQMLSELSDSITAEEEMRKIEAEKTLKLQEENRRIREEIELENVRKLENLNLHSPKIDDLKHNVPSEKTSKHDFSSSEHKVETNVQKQSTGTDFISSMDINVENTVKLENDVIENAASDFEKTEAIDVSSYKEIDTNVSEEE